MKDVLEVELRRRSRTVRRARGSRDDDETNDNNNNNNNNARQRKQCLEESKAMVRDTFVRLEKAFVDLEEFVETLVEGKEDFDVRDEVTGKEEFRLAKEQVERVKPSLC